MKKYILTGGPGSGKSSIILELERLGMATIREAAEDVIKLQQAHGNPEPWTDQDFQTQIYKLQVQRERNILERNYPIFLDRGTIDGLAYAEFRNEDPPIGLRQDLINRNYNNKVFLIENLGNCQNTEVRKENLEEALILENLLEKTYKELGHKIIRIPPATLQERTNLILERID